MSTSSMQDEEHYHKVEAYVSFVYQNLPAPDKHIDQIKECQSKNEICQQLAEYCIHGWPNKSEIPCVLKPYFSIAGEITMQNEPLMRGSRIIIRHHYVQTSWRDYILVTWASLNVENEQGTWFGGLTSVNSLQT